nr:auxilin-like protein [Tanacetum cinerariifolium]
MVSVHEGALMTKEESTAYECGLVHGSVYQASKLVHYTIHFLKSFQRACLDSFGEHAVHCKKLSGFKYRHDMVRDVLFDICRHAGISAMKEAPINFLSDPSNGRSTLRPTSVLVFGWVGEKHACVDLTRFLLLWG